MRQNFIGMVVSDAMQKTIRVKVTSQKVHPIVLKVNLSNFKFTFRLPLYTNSNVLDH